jgi:tRNA threonylcarbamoyladenosine biosynthesis protein TsaE
MKVFHSYSSRETAELGGKIARRILAVKSPRSTAKHACVIALWGELGAGKTTFTQGFAKGLGVKRRLISPTFVIMRHYKLAKSSRARFTDLYHVDAYRMKTAGALEALGIRELAADPKSIMLMEWPEKMNKLLPRDTLRIEFRHGATQHERTITIT